jgi:hypothetical protein
MFTRTLRMATVLTMLMASSPSEAQFIKIILYTVFGIGGGAVLYEGTSKSEAHEVQAENPGAKIHLSAKCIRQLQDSLDDPDSSGVSCD